MFQNKPMKSQLKLEPTTPSFSVNRMSISHLSVQTEQCVIIKPDKLKYEKTGKIKYQTKHV